MWIRKLEITNLIQITSFMKANRSRAPHSLRSPIEEENKYRKERKEKKREKRINLISNKSH